MTCPIGMKNIFVRCVTELPALALTYSPFTLVPNHTKFVIILPGYFVYLLGLAKKIYIFLNIFIFLVKINSTYLEAQTFQEKKRAISDFLMFFFFARLEEFGVH